MMRYLAAAAAVCLAASAAPAQRLLIEVYPSVGPNVFGSPSYAGYAANATTGIGAGGSASEDSGSPTYYQATPDGGTVSILDILATDFPSWRGSANPAAPFDGEFGNRLYFGLRIVDDVGGTVRLSNVSFEITDTHDGSLARSGSFADLDYSFDRVGVIYTDEGRQFVTSGSGNQIVNELWLVGAHTAFELTAADFPGGIPPSGSLAGAVADVPAFQLTARYTLRAPEREQEFFFGEATVNVAPAGNDPDPMVVPAPAGLVLGLIAVAGLIVRRRIVA